VLTEEQKKTYVESGYGHCPYCGGEDIAGGFITVDGNSCSQEISCNSCPKRWFDIYTLTGIEEVE